MTDLLTGEPIPPRCKSRPGQHDSNFMVRDRFDNAGDKFLGSDTEDCLDVGNLLGTRLALNELIAYSKLGTLKSTLDPRSFVIATFALCGFANFSSIGIQLGGIGALAPDRKHDLARLGFRAVLAGTLANYLSAAIAGVLL